MTTSARKARLSPSSISTRVSSKPEKISIWPDSEIQVGTLGAILSNAEAMGRLLAGMASHPENEAFRTSLAGGGEARTTLQHRLHDMPILAKTGSLEYARSLSGYAVLPDGREVAFAIFANNYTAPAYRIMQVID